MTTNVLDASALAALLFAEPGAEQTAELIADGATVCTVNLAEVATLLTRRKRNPRDILPAVVEQIEVSNFEYQDAYAAAALTPATRPAGLSLGDRACLAVAQRLNAPVFTTDRAWLTVELPVAVTCVRPNG